MCSDHTKQTVERPVVIHGMQIVTTANMKIVDEDLRDTATAISASGHIAPSLLIAIQHVLDVTDTLTIEQSLSPDTEGAGAPSVNLDVHYGLQNQQSGSYERMVSLLVSS